MSSYGRAMAALTAGNSSPGVPVFAAGQKVVPGDALGGLGPAGSMVVGSGCYVSESGVVRSRIVGVTNVGVDPGDGGKRTCNVVPFEGDNKKDVIVPKTGDYVTTIHMINSAIVKLGKRTRPMTVYRGVLGGVLPRNFFEPDEFGVMGGVETGCAHTRFSQPHTRPSSPPLARSHPA